MRAAAVRLRSRPMNGLRHRRQLGRSRGRGRLLRERDQQSELRIARHSRQPRSTHDLAYDGCEIYNISKVENAFRSTILYRDIARFGHLKKMLRPSEIDNDLDGSYCERYNDVVRATGIGFNVGIPA